MPDLDLHVHYVTRVEGHGDIFFKSNNGNVEEAYLSIVEAPRFFEAMLKGRGYYEVDKIVSRICGICACGHTLSSLRATEAAMSIEPSLQTINLRKLVLHAENLSSHFLHIFFLVLPDLLNVPSVIPLATANKPLVEKALYLKMLANELSEVIVGRHTHPISTTINGFTKLPEITDLKAIQNKYADSIRFVEEMVDIISTLQFPKFERETEYVSLGVTNGNIEYPFYDGDIVTSDGFVYRPSEYKKITNEWVTKKDTAKHCKHNRSSYMVGALARFNNNYKYLHPEAKKAAAKLNLSAPNHNPYMITVAQLVECVHIMHDVVLLIDKILARGFMQEDIKFSIKAGTGAGAVEVPRGILFHSYTYDEQGTVMGADCVIPTTQNLQNIDDDMTKLAPIIVDKPKEEISKLLQMLVRAYDPCISCSTHLLNVRFK